MLGCVISQGNYKTWLLGLILKSGAMSSRDVLWCPMVSRVKKTQFCFVGWLAVVRMGMVRYRLTQYLYHQWVFPAPGRAGLLVSCRA